jgi:hypothetical protein
MFRLGVILVALSVLFALTAVAFAASARLSHPVRVSVTLAGTLVLGIWFLLD